MLYELSVGRERHQVEVSDQGLNRLVVEIGGETHEIEVIDAGPPLVLAVAGKLVEVGVRGEHVTLDGYEARLLPRASAGASSASSTSSGAVTLNSPMPGRVVRVLCKAGDVVQAGQALLVLEAMKMENELTAPAAATVTELCVSAGAAIEAGALLLRLAPGGQSA